MASRLWSRIVSTWRASQEAQQASPVRMRRSILATFAMAAVGFVVAFVAPAVVLYGYVVAALTGFVLITAALHRQDRTMNAT